MSTEYEPAFQRIFIRALLHLTQIFFVCRKQRFSRVRRSLTCRAIISSGTTPRKRAIRARRFSQRKNHFRSYGLGIPEHDTEGRVITLEFENYYFITVYVPNSRDGLVRLDYRMEWEDAFREYICRLDEKKPVIFCGDLNVAHKEIDLKNPKTNRKNPGFTDEERAKFSGMLESGFIDSFRFFYPDLENVYSWWSYRFSARAKNAGWRIDYFIVSEKLRDNLKGAKIHNEIFGSDHCPVELEIEL